MTIAARTIRSIKESIAQKGELPALPSALKRILETGSQSGADEDGLASAILGDFSVSQKVLRLANSPMYATFGPISTVSRAIHVLGTSSVLHLAMGAKMLDNLGQVAETGLARDELSKAATAAALARSVASKVSKTEGEAASVATLMRCVGKLLVCFYLPAEYSEINEACSELGAEDDVAERILGIDFQSIAKEVAVDWKLPTELTDMMARPGPEASANAVWRSKVTDFSRSYIDAVSRGASQEQLKELATSYEEAIGASADVLAQEAATSLRHSQVDAKAEGCGWFCPELKKVAEGPPETSLALGLTEIERAYDELSLPRLMGMVTEVLWSGLGCRNALLFVRNGTRGVYTLTIAHGAQTTDLQGKLSFDEAFSPNVVHVALSHGSPVYLGEAQEPSIVKKIPDWVKRTVPNAHSILLLPFAAKNKVGALLYLDWSGAAYEALERVDKRNIERLRYLVMKKFEQMAEALARTASPV